MNLNAITANTAGYAFLIIFQILLVVLVIGLGIKLIMLLKNRPKKAGAGQDEKAQEENKAKEQPQQKQVVIVVKDGKTTSEEQKEEEEELEEAPAEKKPNKVVVWWTKFVSLFHKKPQEETAEEEKPSEEAATEAKEPRERIIVIQAGTQEQPAEEPAKEENAEDEAKTEEAPAEKKPNIIVIWWRKFISLFRRKPKEEPAEEEAATEETAAEEEVAAAEETPAERIIVLQAEPQIVYVEKEAEEVQEAPAPAPEPEPAETADEAFDEDDDDEIELEEESVDGGKVTYNRSFTAKYIQAPDEVKNYYVHLKNRLLGYKRVRANTSWKRESFICGRKPMARLVFRGKTLCLFLPLDPTQFVDSKYLVENVSHTTMYSDTPCLYRIKNDRRLEYAYELLEMVAANLGTALTEVPEKDYYLPYEGIVQLIDKGLVKRVIRHNSTDYINS